MKVLPLVLLSFALVACGDEDVEPEATLAAIQTEIFDKSCAFSSCHDSTSPAGSLDLSTGNSQAQLVGIDATHKDAAGKKLVVASDPDNSYLIQRLEGSVSAPRMPEGGAALSDEKIAQIRQWISDGAK